MPRRRMIDPFFYNDPKVGKLSLAERALIIGCICQADDEGRLQGDPAFLKSEIFKYDNDLDNTNVQNLRDSCLQKMQSWPATHPYRILLYSNSDEEYLFFPNWAATNRPSHATKSQLPTPSLETLPIFSGATPEAVANPPAQAQASLSRTSPESLASPSALGQSSLGKVSIGKGSVVPEDFTKYLSNDNDLTDFLTTTLEKYLPRGPTQVMPVMRKLWLQATGEEINGEVFQAVYRALQKYPVPVLAKSLAKGVKYSPGKTKPAKYIQTVFDEQMKEYEKNRSP